MAGSWKSGEVLAWTEGDGPGRPPSGPGRAIPFALAGALAVVFAGILSSDTLCPDHRAWVQALGTVGLAGTVLAITGLVRGWAMAPLLTLTAASTGVSIGLIDAIHDPTRGRLIAVGFAVVCFGAVALALKARGLRAWDRSLRRSLRSAAPAEFPADDGRTAGQPPTERSEAGQSEAGQSEPSQPQLQQ
jgi:hypothetical protein